MRNQHTISPEEWELIEQYLSGEMAPGSYESFELRLANDPILREKLEEARLLITGIKEVVLGDKLQDFHHQFETSAKVSSVRKRIYWLAAASIFVILALGAILLFTRDSKNERLFSDYFVADPGLATAMSVSEDYEFNHGMIDYKTGSYNAAIETWRTLLIAKPGNDTLHYFSGVAFLALEKTDSAIYHLEQSLNSKQSSFSSDANWFLGLALLKQNKRTAAISYLKQSDHLKKDELLSRLN